MSRPKITLPLGESVESFEDWLQKNCSNLKEPREEIEEQFWTLSPPISRVCEPNILPFAQYKLTSDGNYALLEAVSDEELLDPDSDPLEKQRLLEYIIQPLVPPSELTIMWNKAPACAGQVLRAIGEKWATHEVEAFFTETQVGWEALNESVWSVYWFAVEIEEKRRLASTAYTLKSNPESWRRLSSGEQLDRYQAMAEYQSLVENWALFRSWYRTASPDISLTNAPSDRVRYAISSLQALEDFARHIQAPSTHNDIQLSLQTQKLNTALQNLEKPESTQANVEVFEHDLTQLFQTKESTLCPVVIYMLKSLKYRLEMVKRKLSGDLNVGISLDTVDTVSANTSIGAVAAIKASASVDLLKASSMALSKAIEDLLLDTQARARAKDTISFYETRLMPFLDFLGDVPIATVTYDDIMSFVSYLRNRDTLWPGHPLGIESDGNLSTGYINTYIRSILRLFNYAKQRGYLDEKPTQTLKQFDTGEQIPNAITQKEQIALLNTTVEGAPIDIRDQAIILILTDTGCRVGGLCGITIEDIWFDQGLIEVKEKWNKSRYVPFLPITGYVLKSWLKVRPEDDENWLFIGMGNSPTGQLKENGVRQMLRRRAERANIEKKRIYPHAFRHAFARDFLLHGGNLALLSDIMGHSSITVTKEHYAIFLTHEIQQAHRQHSPLVQLYDQPAFRAIVQPHLPDNIGGDPNQTGNEESLDELYLNPKLIQGMIGNDFLKINDSLGIFNALNTAAQTAWNVLAQQQLGIRDIQIADNTTPDVSVGSIFFALSYVLYQMGLYTINGAPTSENCSAWINSIAASGE